MHKALLYHVHLPFYVYMKKIKLEVVQQNIDFPLIIPGNQ